MTYSDVNKAWDRLQTTRARERQSELDADIQYCAEKANQLMAHYPGMTRSKALSIAEGWLATDGPNSV